MERSAFDHHIAARLDGEPQTEPLPHTVRYAVGDNWVDIILEDGGTSSLWWATKNEWSASSTSPASSSRPSTVASKEPFDDASREYVFVARR